MLNPRSKTDGVVRFPYTFEKHGRVGRIKKWADSKFGTYFVFGGTKIRNSFRSFEAAWQYLDREFSKLDADKANSLVLHPINHDVKTYSELEHLLREKGGGASLREAVQFYLSHHKRDNFAPKKVSACADAFLAEEKGRKCSSQSKACAAPRAWRR